MHTTETNPAHFAQLLNLVHGYNVSQTIYVAAKLGIADLLAAGPKSAEALADTTHTKAPALFRVLRALSSIGIFERQGDLFALAPLGELLRSDRPDSLRAAATLFNEEPYRAHAELLNTVRTGETAFNRLYGMGHFEYLETHPEAAETFNSAMVQMTRRLNDDITRLYDFAEGELVVDVGGGYGRLVAGILAANLGVQGAVFDLASAVAGAPALMQAAGVADRCEVIVGDMFDNMPISADVYVLKSVIHDWDDERCETILRNIRKSIRPDGKLLLVERLIDDGNEPCWGKFVDLVMLVVSGGRERTVAEYTSMYAASGFKLTRTIAIANGFAIIEGVPA
jgi:hypothetical protein